MTRRVRDDIVDEYLRASSNFPPFHSAHEGYAVILEEVRELEAEVFKNPEVRRIGLMRWEAVQVAAMAMRFIRDVCDPPLKNPPLRERLRKE